MKRLLLNIFVLGVMSSNLDAHHLYINLSMPLMDRPPDVSSNIGWGHTLPMDDFLQGDMLSSYSVYDPNMKKLDFKVDRDANAGLDEKIYLSKPENSFPSASVFDGDSFAKKLYFDKNATHGVYQFTATNSGVQFSIWKDKNNRRKWGRKYLDELKDAKEVMLCWTFKSYAKAFLGYGEWHEPKPVGHELEFIPVSDLRNIKVGDEVEFKVLFMGEPLHSINPNGGSADTTQAYNEQLGATFVGGFVVNGRVRFKVLASGRWLLTLGIIRPVNQKNAPHLVGRALNIGYNATATFFVKEK